MASSGNTSLEQPHSYASSMKAARSLGLKSGHISACSRGERKQMGGYDFRWGGGVPNEAAVLEGEVWMYVVSL